MFKGIGILVLIVIGILGAAFYHSTANIHKLFTENYRLSKAIHNLTQEQQIGYAVLESQTRDPSGRILNTVRFVQTAPDNPRVVVSEQSFTLSSDIIYFDALIVKFTDKFVKDGKERALYLWRRIYGEDTAPVEGQSIEIPGTAPERYNSINQSLGFLDKQMFWSSIWDLANDTKGLSDYGITAIFGNAVYIRPKPGKVYLFKISPTGQIYPETINDY
jgi:hypothetical protein